MAEENVNRLMEQKTFYRKDELQTMFKITTGNPQAGLAMHMKFLAFWKIFHMSHALPEGTDIRNSRVEEISHDAAVKHFSHLLVKIH